MAVGAESVYGELLRVLAALAVVVPAAYLSTRFLTGRGLARRGRYMKRVESLALGAHHGLHLVQVGERLFLVGASEKGVHLLAEVDRASELHPLAAAGSPADGAAQAPWLPGGSPAAAGVLGGFRRWRGRQEAGGGDHGQRAKGQGG
ncbi:flagellar biosynthetic protein FliO [Limnochorda pilosa]|uniref:Flagellar biosynthetic protein FliO n=1 Tax=Limnochorda pilosa TaxID=1555112 RepID=A0A0K2SKG7_LIMPI|nr:flagellar biosynthetic protein FliO [Limnochorda pilosa]BAS27512.1 flagellar biosynthetic protein FliO [Limnochorda pilosa]